MANINVENAEDLQSQIEEVEALSSIYGDEWCVIDEAARIFCIKITDDIDHPKLKACLQIILPPDYPSTAPPVYQINAAWLRGLDRMALSNSLEELYVENAGESILYLWVEKVREFLLEKARCKDITEQPEGQIMTAEEGVVEDDDEIADCQALKQNAQNKQFFDNYSCELPSIKHGGTITDRRSTFQSHLAPVVTPGQVRMVLDKLYENKKIASATHNIYAYRSWMCGTCWWLSLAGTEGFSWVRTVLNTSTTRLGMFLSRKDTLSRWMRHPKLEARAKSQKARRLNRSVCGKVCGNVLC
uniref:RWD domain-containing protein n=1 Tax=Esox lucius TaxID=8010 RepID=A0A3P8ZWB6_ESOLU